MAAGRTCSDQEDGSPSFFKVIRYPSSPHLKLPNAFVRRYFEKIPKNPILVTATGGHSWRLKFVKMGEDYCFANGWENLVKDVQLCIRDIVIFWLIDHSTFQVAFLGANGCEKDLPFTKNKNNFADDDEIVSGCHNDDDYYDEDLCFEKVISRKTYKYAMSLPMKFVRAAGLEHTEKIKLTDREGREWKMKIHVERCGRRTKYSLTVGWAIFRRHHRLSDGDVCKFTFNKKEGVLNLTQVLRSKRPFRQEPPIEEVNRNRGRTSYYDGVNVKIEDDWSPTEIPCNVGVGGGVKAKTGYESGHETEVVKRKSGYPELGFSDVRIEDGSNAEILVDKIKGGMPPMTEKPSRAGGGGVDWRTEEEMERVSRSKHVIYF